MAYRIRTVKPDAWQSEQVCAVSREARLLWVVLITMSDDEGRFRWRPQTVLGHGFPADEDAAGQLEGWLAELIREGLVIVYTHHRSTLGAHPNWRSHQRIDKPKASTLPGPDDDDSRVRVADVSATHPGSVPPASPQASPERSTREGKGVGDAPAGSHAPDGPGGLSVLTSGGDGQVGALSIPSVPQPYGNAGDRGDASNGGQS